MEMTPGDSLPRDRHGTLGDLLYADASQVVVPEKDWQDLVRAIAAGDQLALHALYERTYRAVFTLIMRMSSNRMIAEELTLDVYHDVWQRASRFDGASGTVLGWIMNQARFKAIDRVRFEQRKRQAGPEHGGLLAIDAPDYRDVLQIKEQGRVLRNALAFLGAEEREAVEAAFFSELPLAAVASRSGQSIGVVKERIRSGLHKLREALPKAAMKDTNTPRLANGCDQAELACAHALRALPEEDVPALEAHLASCWQCRRELDSMRPVLDAFLVWPVDVLRPPASLQERLAQHIATLTGGGKPALPARRRWPEPRWEAVAPGIACKLLATDEKKQVVSMLVRLVPGGRYPAHTHAGVEELHLLDGELWIDERKLHAGDYNHAKPGTGDQHVWSETGCTCFIVTSTNDILR